MQYEFTRLEQLIQQMHMAQAKAISEEQLNEWSQEMLEEKERLQQTLSLKISEQEHDPEKVSKYIRYHHDRLKILYLEAEKLPDPVRDKVRYSLSDLILYFELNEDLPEQPEKQDVFFGKAYVPFSVEVLALLCKLVWDEGLVRMRFKSHLVKQLSKSVMTLKTGNRGNISEKHLNDAMYQFSNATINSAERILNRLKMRLNAIKSESKMH